MDRLVIEIKNRALHLRSHQIYSNFPVKIGRGYSNDIVIPDPYVCKEHLEIYENEFGEFEIKDLDSKNGIFINSKKTTEPIIKIKTGDRVRIGHTLLKFASPDQPMAETIIMKKGILNPEGIQLIAFAWLSVILTFLFLYFEEYMETFTKFSSSKITSEAIAPAFIPIIWAGVWAVVGKISKHHSYFHEQLLVTTLGFLAMLLIQTFTGYLEFFTNSTLIGIIGRYILETVLFLTLLHENFRIATQIREKSLKLSATLGTLIIMGLSTIEAFASSSDFNEEPSYSKVLKAPIIKFLPTTSKENFFKDCEDL